jgi:hypothetical protein
MSSQQDLENFGIRTGEDVSHRNLADSNYLDPESYFGEAEILLRSLQPVVNESLVEELGDYSDKWNPGGFMVFPLGIHDSLGSVRLHVWPPNVERKSANGPNIHNHAWHLSSLIHKGIYSDIIFDLEESEVQDTEQAPGSLKLYHTHRKGDGRDVLITDGKVIVPKAREAREIKENEVHNIEAGTYHIPTVPFEGHAVTLVLDSPAFATTTGVLLARKEPEIARVRRPLDLGDIALAQEIILAE